MVAFSGISVSVTACRRVMLAKRPRIWDYGTAEHARRVGVTDQHRRNKASYLVQTPYS